MQAVRGSMTSGLKANSLSFFESLVMGVAGSAPGYTYSEAMSKAGLTWDPATLDKYLADPHAMVPNTKMAFLGVKKPDDRQAIIDYLGSLK